MAYEAPALGTAGQVYTAAAHNIIVNDILDHETRLPDVTAAKIAFYQFTGWNGVSGATAAPSATALASLANATYFTLANASGTLTITFKVAGYYYVDIVLGVGSNADMTSSSLAVAFGGTATRYGAATSSRVNANGAYSAYTSAGAYNILVSATADQTITILPQYESTFTSGNHTAQAAVRASFKGV